MEFLFRAVDEKQASSSSGANGYFSDKPLQAGILGAGGDIAKKSITSLAMPSKELFSQEIDPERIREEIFEEMGSPAMTPYSRDKERERVRQEIMRETEQRRILEEEVRRELEKERLIAMRMGRSRVFSPLEQEATVKEDLVVGLVRPLSEAPSAEKRPAGFHPRTEEEEKHPLSSQKLGNGRGISPEFAEVQPSKRRNNGTKRKAVGDAESNRRKARKPWFCNICQVNATSENSLKDHLEGKKHKVKAAALRIGIPGSECGDQDDDSTIVTRNVNILVDGKFHKVLERRGWLFCELCDVKFNSTIAMAAHLSEEEHIAMMRDAEKDRTRAEEKKAKEYENIVMTGSAPKNSMEKGERSGLEEEDNYYGKENDNDSENDQKTAKAGNAESDVEEDEKIATQFTTRYSLVDEDYEAGSR